MNPPVATSGLWNLIHPMNLNDQQHESQEHQGYQDFHVQPIQKKRVGFWAKIGGGSLTIAVLSHLALLVAGVFIVFRSIQPNEIHPPMTPNGGGGGGNGERTLEYEVKQRKLAQATPSTDVSRIVAEGAVTACPILEQEKTFAQVALLKSITSGGHSGLGGFGGSSGLSNGGGGILGKGTHYGSNGDASGRLFPEIPMVFGKRCSREDRLERLRANGGTVECEDAVVKGLQWLKANQNSDGSWGDSRKVAMTGFALLAYFGHCETPASEEFGDSCTRGIVYLVNLGIQNNGRLANGFSDKSWCYEHAIATYALGEASTFMKDLKEISIPSLMEITEKAGQFIIENQNSNGGWAYSYEISAGHTDVSVTGWQVQALKACEHSRLEFKGMKNCIKDALAYLDTCQAENGGYGYTGPNPAGQTSYCTLTGVGILCNQMWGKGSRSEVRKATKYLVANSKFDYNSEFADLYGHYYESQAMMQRGGSDWTFYNAMFRAQLLNNQNADGSWKSPGGGKKIRAVGALYVGESGDARIYRTSLCALMLEVYYRFLSTGGGGGSRPGI